MTYLKVFTDFRELMEPLNAEEKGRLFEAMLAYAMDGAEVALEGNERFVWPVARRQIDQEAAVYELKVNSASKARASRWKRSSEPREDALVSEPTALISDKEQEQDQEQKEDQYQDHSQEYVYEQEQPPAGGHTHTGARGNRELSSGTATMRPTSHLLTNLKTLSESGRRGRSFLEFIRPLAYNEPKVSSIKGEGCPWNRRDGSRTP